MLNAFVGSEQLCFVGESEVEEVEFMAKSESTR
jgi:hypothetical protein